MKIPLTFLQGRCSVLFACRWVLALAVLAASPVRAALALAVDGRALADIVISDDAPASVVAAADYLKSNLRRVTGAEFKVVKAGAVAAAPERLIAVGASRFTVEAGIDPGRLRPEGFVVRSTDRRLFIVGVDSRESWGDRGTWHGVCDFVERELGVRWLWPGELGLVAPPQARLTLEPAERTDAPAIHARVVRDNLLKPFNARTHEILQAYGAKPGGMERMADEALAWLRHHRVGHDARTGGNSVINYDHAFIDWWTKYGESNPEYFAQMPDGSRRWPYAQIPAMAKICVSNLAVADRWMENAREFFRQNPEALVYSASANDGGYSGNCVCPQCEAWDAPQGETYSMKWIAGGQPVEALHVSLSDRYVRFYNILAERLAREFPGKQVGAHAYLCWRNPPVRERKLHPQTLIAFVGIADAYVSDRARGRDIEQWNGWATVTRNLYYRPNTFHIGDGMPLVYTGKLARDLRHRFDSGMKGVWFDSILHHWATTGLNYYVLPKILWDPHVDVDAVIADYCRAGFGPAAEAVRGYFADIEEWTNRIALEPHYFDNGRKQLFVPTAPDLYPWRVLERWRARLHAALGQVPENSVYAQRIAWLDAGLEYAFAQVRVFELSRKAHLDATERALLEKRIAARDQWFREHLHDFTVSAPWLHVVREKVTGFPRPDRGSAPSAALPRGT